MPDQRKKKKNAPQGYIPAPGDQPRTGEQGQMNDQQQEMHDQIEQSGSVTPMEGRHAIHCLTIIGQIEGHYDAPPQTKTTKYEHVIPQLVAVEQDPRIEGLLMILNTVGGDVEAGLALAAADIRSGCRWPAARGAPLLCRARR